jgi:Domain of unknown function (DUF4291)
MSKCIVRAKYTESTVRVYQAYPRAIAGPALAAGTLVSPFKKDRTTWIKPSFNWMMYRSEFATKTGQEVVLGIDITRDGFEWALRKGVLSSFPAAMHSTRDDWRKLLATRPVRIQWDPARDWRLNIVPNVRTIQIGLRAEAVERFINKWIIHIEDVTPAARLLQTSIEHRVDPQLLLDKSEVPYPIDARLAAQIGATSYGTSNFHL